MSTNLDKAVGPESKDDVHVTSFNGGERGQMLQMSQGYAGDVHIVHVDEAQARHTIAVMQAWLNR